MERVGDSVRYDRATAWTGLAFSIPFTVFLYLKFGTLVYLAVGLLCPVACLICLFLIRKPRRQEPLPVHYLDAAYWLLTVSSLLVFAFRPDQYSRPLLFFVLIALSGSVLAVKFVFCRKPLVRHSLIQILFLGFLIDWTVTVMFPSLIGLDPYTCRQWAAKIIAGTEQITFPAMVAMVSWVVVLMQGLNLDYNRAAFWRVTRGQSVTGGGLV